MLVFSSIGVALALTMLLSILTAAGLLNAPRLWRIATAPFRWAFGLPGRLVDRGIAFIDRRRLAAEMLRRAKAAADEAEERAQNEQLKELWRRERE